MTGAAAKTCLVEGILFYFPTKNGTTTVPDTTSVFSQSTVGPSHIEPTQVRSTQVAPGSSSTLAEDMGVSSGPTCSVYWQDRLVPETEITSFPFFPEWKTARMCEQNSVPVDWRDRIRGFLFFGWDFRHISNNKLKFQVDPNMNDWLNNKRRYRTEIKTAPMKLSEHFQRCDGSQYKILHTKAYACDLNLFLFAVGCSFATKISMRTAPFPILSLATRTRRDSTSCRWD